MKLEDFDAADHPATITRGLEASGLGCKWLLARWDELGRSSMKTEWAGERPSDSALQNAGNSCGGCDFQQGIDHAFALAR